jgi:hypothetical protein
MRSGVTEGIRRGIVGSYPVMAFCRNATATQSTRFLRILFKYVTLGLKYFLPECGLSLAWWTPGLGSSCSRASSYPGFP